jgi:hypothetical protein
MEAKESNWVTGHVTGRWTGRGLGMTDVSG